MNTISRTGTFRHLLRWTLIASVGALLIVPFQNFNFTDNSQVPPEQDEKEAATVGEADYSARALFPKYKYTIADRQHKNVKLPSWYVPSGQMTYRSTSEDIPDEEWIKKTEKKFYFTFNDKDDLPAAEPSPIAPSKNAVLNDGRVSPRTPKKDEITWQLIDRDGKGKIQYYGPVKMEAEYNIGTGDSVFKVLQPINKVSGMSVEANMKDAKSTINYNYSW